jgi:hypothetical protein
MTIGSVRSPETQLERKTVCRSGSSGAQSRCGSPRLTINSIAPSGRIIFRNRLGSRPRTIQRCSTCGASGGATRRMRWLSMVPSFRHRAFRRQGRPRPSLRLNSSLVTGHFSLSFQTLRQYKPEHIAIRSQARSGSDTFKCVRPANAGNGLNGCRGQVLVSIARLRPYAAIRT